MSHSLRIGDPYVIDVTERFGGATKFYFDWVCQALPDCARNAVLQRAKTDYRLSEDLCSLQEIAVLDDVRSSRSMLDSALKASTLLVKYESNSRFCFCIDDCAFLKAPSVRLIRSSQLIQIIESVLELLLAAWRSSDARCSQFLSRRSVSIISKKFARLLDDVRVSRLFCQTRGELAFSKLLICVAPRVFETHRSMWSYDIGFFRFVEEHVPPSERHHIVDLVRFSEARVCEIVVDVCRNHGINLGECDDLNSYLHRIFLSASLPVTPAFCAYYHVD